MLTVLRAIPALAVLALVAAVPAKAAGSRELASANSGLARSPGATGSAGHD